ncbi:MAG: 5-(carboxyamino)imidazole ribonucleotide synthase [Fimbriimonadales bacterium]|nr:5-(carboxyamino)imidazole ribonucleotide synthase [Fimbriimonadales bacterium]
MTIGVLGGGQLGRMIALAGYPLGLRFLFVDPSEDPCAGRVAPVVKQHYMDAQGVQERLRQLQVVTYEFENVDADSPWLAGDVDVYPPVEALRVTQDRLLEKRCFRELGIETPTFTPVDSDSELQGSLSRIGLPCVLKTRRFGYDGKGQSVIRTVDDAAEIEIHAACILESFVQFDRELSIIAVRGKNGETAFYPLVENEHRNGILYKSISPSPNVSKSVQSLAEDYARRVMEKLDYVGVLAIEFFQYGERLLANEMAPRVHNSGHFSIEGSDTSQFENHLRAITGLPLGSTGERGLSCMINLVGSIPDIDKVLAIPGAHLHLYDKEPRPGRKVGHITVVSDSRETLELTVSQVEALVG